MLREDDFEPPVEEFQWYIDAFRELNTTRSATTLRPIPFTAIADYCKLFNIEDIDEFFFIIRCMDFSYIKASDKTTKPEK